MNKVFVYGTLMSGQSANHLLADAVYVGKYILRDYAMYNLGSYPGIQPKLGESVYGEVYDIKDELIPNLDRYEGEGSLYMRMPVKVHNCTESVEAFAYLYNNEINGIPMREGWGAKSEDRVWYACYGSNLSADRFSCYIKGGRCLENGRSYMGCKDTSDWTDSMIKKYKGRMYFGNKSGSWEGKGVAFFDAAGDSEVVMRLYNISRGQLHDLQKQEGASPQWYGRLICLDVLEDGNPVYTITSEDIRPQNAPSDAYLALIRKALVEECGMSEVDTGRYLEERL